MGQYEQGRSVVGEVGELVVTLPTSSMPVMFWGDPGGQRYQESYFDMFPGLWRHGDWIRFDPDGGSVIYGRSDLTINRYGIRMGTAELYRVVEARPEIAESVVVDLEFVGRPSPLTTFVVLQPGKTPDDELVAQLSTTSAPRLRRAMCPTASTRFKRFPGR